MITAAHARAALSLDEFSYRYPAAGADGLDGVSLELAHGEFVLICGRSGSGKSTLLRVASGLVPHHFGGSVSGEAAICGLDLRGQNAGSLAAYCGSVFQDPEIQVVMGSVRHEIAFSLENAGWEQGAIDVAVEETALAVGTHHLLPRRTSELSGGELQRVVLAAALAPRPALLALDEPTSQLDPVAADELLATLAGLNNSFGTTVLISDHRIERCIELADRVVALERGAVAFDGAPAAFLEWASSSPATDWMLPPVPKMFSLAGMAPLPVTLKQARTSLGNAAFERGAAGPGGGTVATGEAPNGLAGRRSSGGHTPTARVLAPGRSGRDARCVLRADRLTHRYRGTERPALEGVTLEVRAGERVALMGANGSGKSTLLRTIKGLERPSGGRIELSGGVGLLLQNPNDYLIHERVADEAPAAQLERFGLAGLAERDPRDLSGGERQRLALAIVTGDDPALLLLDEPSRGMDRERKGELVALLDPITGGGTALIVATHDAEFAAAFADRVIVLGGGRLLADGHPRQVLAGGWHFATEVAKLLPGRGVLTPEQGAFVIDGGASSALGDGALSSIGAAVAVRGPTGRRLP